MSSLSEQVHGFWSETAVLAYCGEVVRPDPDKPRMIGTPGDRTGVPPNACPECAATYRLLRS